MDEQNLPVYISDLDLEGLRDLVHSLGLPTYRAGQITRWIYRQGVFDFQRMTDLPAGVRDVLTSRARAHSGEVITRLDGADGTTKFAVVLPDGQVIETVLLAYRFGYSVCVSTQAGCRMGCRFCASTIGGRVRDLTPGEMMTQVLIAHEEALSRPASGRAGSDPDDPDHEGTFVSGTSTRGPLFGVRRVVLMGSGEPFDNYSSVLEFLHRLVHPGLMGLGARRITVSTSGIVPGILDLARSGLGVNLAVSLHAPDDATRTMLMPIARKWPVSEVIGASQEYFRLTGRRVTFEYALIKGVNDSREQAEELARLLSGFPCHVNLIRLNPVAAGKFVPADKYTVEQFAGVLAAHHVAVTVRRQLGIDIDAACGQLRRRFAPVYTGAGTGEDDTGEDNS